MKIDITLIPHAVQVGAGKLAKISMAIEAALKSNAAIDIEAIINQYYPGAGVLEAELIQLCEAAIKTCQKIQAEDWSGVTARLQRLVSDSTNILTGKEHGISKCISWCEIIIRDLLDSKAAGIVKHTP